MIAAPRSVRRLWAALGALLALGSAAYIHFLVTGSYDSLVLFFRNPGSAFFVVIAGIEAYLARRAYSQFEFSEPMHMVWTLVFLSACCRLTGAALGQVLSADIPWNPLVVFKLFHLNQSGNWRDIGLVIGGPAAMAFLVAGLMYAIILTRRLGVLSRLTTADWMLIAIIATFTARELYEIGVIAFVRHERASVTQTLLWFSDPLLTLLLMQAVSIRRSVLNMGQGLVARCWGMMAAGVAFTSAGDVALWAESHGLIPTALSPLGWFIWFFAATAFASAPCYQIEAVRLAHEGSYAVPFSKSFSG